MRILVTGGTSGIGAAVAEAAAGTHDVITASRTGGDIRCDVSDWAAVKAALGGLEVDAVVANAGIGAARGLTNDDPERWREMVLTNVLGTAHTLRATLPGIKARRGHFVLTGSVSGRYVLQGSVYSATKAAVAALADAARQELGGSGARVTLVAPGTTDTPFFDNPQADALRPEDVARAVLWALERPPHVDVSEVLVRPTAQRYP